MLIKKYMDFIAESNDENLGEWCESLWSDEYVRNIINRYIGESTPDIRLSNAINILDEMTKSEIRSQIQKYLNSGIEEKEPDILTSTDTEDLMEAAGSSVFKSFLKCLLAFGGGELVPNWKECPGNFLFYYSIGELESSNVREILGRFRSMNSTISLLHYDKNQVGFYFGIKLDATMEYGIRYESELIPVGSFKLGASAIKSVLGIETKVVSNLKKELVNLNLADILTLGKIKSDMFAFTPGYHESVGPVQISDKVISFSWNGVGKWDNGKFDEGEFQNIKGNLSSFILSKKWGDRVLISVKPMSYWLYIHIKLK